MNNEKFDQEVLKKIREALGDFHPRYLNKVYGDITLEEQLKKTDDIKNLKDRLDRPETNHLQHLQEDIYTMGIKVNRVLEALKENGFELEDK
jgi:hypothetical protein